MDEDYLFGKTDPGREIREVGWEHPSPDFTDKVMDRLLAVSPTPIAYKPLIPGWGWWLLFLGTGLTLSAAFTGIISFEIGEYTGRLAEILSSVSLTPVIRGLELSSPFVYGALALVVFLYLHLVLLRFYGAATRRELQVERPYK